MSNITLNIVEPGSGPTPDPVVPNTGLFTHGIGGPEATIITVSTILVLALVAFVVWYYKKHTNIHLSNITKHIKTRKSIPIGLTVLAILVSAGTFASLLINAGKSNTNAVEGEDDSSLTVDVSDEELTIEVGSEPVFAVLPVKASVEEATQAGYTLTAYADSTDLVSTTDPSNIIPMVTLPEPLAPNEEGVGRGWGPVTKLTDNTYGLALGEEPTSKDAEVYTSLSTDSLNPTIIKSMTEYTPTPANDTTTIYYGFYITPDIPYGTYTNDGEVYYNATINTTLVTFDGKELYFDDDEQQTTNTVEYIAVSQENNGTETSSTINQPISGEYKTPSQSLPYRFLGWSTDPTATEPTYTSEDDIAEHLPISPNIPLTLYAVWQKATTITFDSNDGAGTMDKQTIIAGESANLYPNTFTREGYTFTGWNTEAEPTTQEPGKSYADEAEYTAPQNISQNLTLYAQWKKLPVIGDLINMQDFATLTEEDKASVLNSMSQETSYTLKDKRDEQDYTVAKLKDNNIWMTRNLNLAGGAEITSELSNVPDNYTLPTANGFQEGNKLPASSTSGFVDDTKAFVYNSTKTSGTDCSSPGCYSYYSWTAATAGSGISIADDNTDAPYSICPKGWKLPSTRTTATADWKTESDFYKLAVAYGMNSSDTWQSTSNFYDQAGPDTTPNFLLTGYYRNSSFFIGGSYGLYWSSTSLSSTSARYLDFNSSRVNSANDGGRRYGGAVRCIAV